MCFYAFLSDLSKKAYRKSLALMGMASFFLQKKRWNGQQEESFLKMPKVSAPKK